ncbi:hypothetical protein MCEMRE182_00031 [Candidatus Nanopelagicaceae bacterium]
MKIQSAGRLGNNLFIWAYAYGVSIKSEKRASIFWDKYHSKIGAEELETANLLESKYVHFSQSNLLGAVLKFLDWIRRFARWPYRCICFVLRIGTEGEGTLNRRNIIRGFFQESKFVLANDTSINLLLSNALDKVENKSLFLKDFKTKFPEYQVIHLRLGDYVGSSFGVIDPASYKRLLDPELPIVICTNGAKTEISQFLGFQADYVISPEESTAWETLVIFTNAARFIGVNSTLSWWGAFLVSRRGFPAYLPQHWNLNMQSDFANKLNINGVSAYENDFLQNL